jgi:hypothetical protein
MRKPRDASPIFPYAAFGNLVAAFRIHESPQRIRARGGHLYPTMQERTGIDPYRSLAACKSCRSITFASAAADSCSVELGVVLRALAGEEDA